MASEAPPFWWNEAGWQAYALYPLSRVYGFFAGRGMVSARRERIDAPVLCVGNFTVGGTGKTPLAIALAKQAQRMHLSPGFLTRGHGGSITGPHIVDKAQDSARQVGDEPLLLSEHCPTVITRRRAAGAALLVEQGCNFLIMDDGFQSAQLHMDHALMVVDGRYGVGNGHVLPAGPLRARLVDQVRFATGIVIMGEDKSGDAVVRQAARAGRPIFQASIRTRDPERFSGRRFLAFAGIGHPDKFFQTVADVGGTVVMSRPFPDHHFYQPHELRELATTAQAADLELITTLKDAVRLGGGMAAQDFLNRLAVLEIDAFFDDGNAAERIVDETLDAWRARRLTG